MWLNGKEYILWSRAMVNQWYSDGIPQSSYTKKTSPIYTKNVDRILFVNA